MTDCDLRKEDGQVDALNAVNGACATRIPKVIHYIWLGGKSLDKLSVKCMESWKKYLPEYKIVEWNDAKCKDVIAGNQYASQAYAAKKYAFVSDYLRLYALYHYGGIYMDTDVQVLKPLDCFLNEEAFTCFENKSMIPTALMAAAKGNEWIKMLLDDYETRQFVKPDGSMDLTTNVEVISRLSASWGFIPGGEEHVLRSGVHIYTKDYFCPLDTSASKNDIITDNTYAMHLYNGSWQSPLRRKLSKLKKKLGINPKALLGERLYGWLKKI